MSNPFNCPCCGKKWSSAADYHGVTGIRSRDGLTWTRIELDDETIKNLFTGFYRLQAVYVPATADERAAAAGDPSEPVLPPSWTKGGVSPTDTAVPTDPDLLRLAMNVALFQARDRMVALALELRGARVSLPLVERGADDTAGLHIFPIG